MQIIKNAISRITGRNVWIGSLLNRLNFEYDKHGIPTMATNGKQVIVNSEFAKSLYHGQLDAVLVHEALHVINRHPLRRGSRDPMAFNIACDHAINGIVKALGYKLPDGALKPWVNVTGEDRTAEQIYSEIWPDIDQQRQEQMQELADAIADQDPGDSGDTNPSGGSSSDATGDPTASDSGDSGDETQESGNSDDSGDSKPADESGDSPDGWAEADTSTSDDEDQDANSECNSDSEESESGDEDAVKGEPGNAAEEGGEDLMDYPLAPGQTMADAEREMDTLMAKAKMDAMTAPGKSQPTAGERVVFDRKEYGLDWLKELEEYMQEIGGTDYSMRPPNKRLASAGIIANSLNPSGCGNVVAVVDVSGSIDKPKLDVFLTNLELFMENIDFESLRIIACASHVRWDRTFLRGEIFDVSEMPVGGGTAFSPAFDLIAEGAEPDLVMYFTDMEVAASDAPEDPPNYPVLWLTDDDSIVDTVTGKIKQNDSSFDYYFRPDWGDAILTTQ